MNLLPALASGRFCCRQFHSGIFRLVEDVAANEFGHVGWTLEASEPRVEEKLCNTRSSLNLCLQDVGLKSSSWELSSCWRRSRE